MIEALVAALFTLLARLFGDLIVAFYSGGMG